MACIIIGASQSEPIQKKIAVFIMQYSMRVRISQVGKDRHVDRMLTLIVAHQSRSQCQNWTEENSLLKGRRSRLKQYTSLESYNL